MKQITFEDKIDELLTIMTSFESKYLDKNKFNSISLKYFDGAEPIKYLESFYTEEYINDGIIFSDVKPSDLSSNFDFKSIVGDKDNNKNFIINRYKKINNKEYLKFKNYIGKFNPYIIESSVAMFDLEKKIFETGRYFMGYYPNNNNGNNLTWKKLNDNNLITKEEKIEENERIQILMGWQFQNYYNWKVYVGWEGEIGITFATDPIGAREIFRLRDIPNGKKRRTALRNWIKEHYRKKRNDPTEKNKVIKHLRGATEFNWNGFKCKIIPSEYDLKQAEKIKLIK